ncbi:MAG: thiol reductant ABC exporter subunit CydC [Xanthobacter sp.]
MKDLMRLLRLMRPHGWWMVLAIIVSALATLSHIALMATSGWFITAMGLAGLTGVTINYFTPAALIRGFAMARTGGRYVERIVGHEATLKFVASLRPWFFERLTPLAPAAIEDQRSGDLLTRLKGDIDRLEFAFLRIISPGVAGLLVLIVGLLFVAGHDGAIALMLLITTFAAGAGLPLLIYRLGAPAARQVTARSAELNAHLVDHIQARAELDIYDPDALHRALVDETSDTLIREDGRLAGLSAFSTAGVGLAAQLSLLLVLVMGAPHVLDGTMAGPNLPMLALLSLALFEAVAPLPLAFQTLPGTLASARRIFSMVDRPAPVPAVSNPKPVPARGDLVFAHAGLTYPGAEAPALRDLDLTLSPGKRIGIIGPSGSGKSSIVSLALRFRAPDKGDIRFGDDSVDAYDPDALRKRMTVLSQHDHLFSATIRDNLRIAAPQANDAALEAACEKAGILPFIKAQPQGLDTFVGVHGAKVSGGEARRLGLARTLLKDAPLLILDEPTEGLDTDTERRVLDALLADTGEKSVLLITHRHAGLEQMDEVVVMENGHIIARGTPAQMMHHMGPATAGAEGESPA